MSALLKLEVELTGDKVYHDWLTDIEADAIRSKREYIQVFDIKAGSCHKSPLLGKDKLPIFSGNLNELIIRNIELPHGKLGRAVGILIHPAEDVEDELDPEQRNIHKPEDFPQVFVMAQDIHEIDEALTQLLKTFLFTGVGAVIMSGLVLYAMINRSLSGVEKLNGQLRKRSNNELCDPIETVEGFPSELDGLIGQYNYLLRKISDLRVREQNFSRHVAHELRTPLSGIIVTLEHALSRDREGAVYREKISEALNITNGMKTLVDTLMCFARLQSGAESIMLHATDVHTSLETVFEKHTASFTKKNLNIIWKLDVYDCIKMTDSSLLEILFSNLVDNAISHSPVGGNLKVISTTTDGRMTLKIINVSELSLPENLEQLFTPFYRLDQAREQEQGHSGIGLSICKEIATALQLQIKLEGTQQMFTVILEFP